jgi:hypothetical protein
MKLSMSHIASISWPIPEDRLSSERQNFYERVAIDFTDFGQSSAKVQMKKTQRKLGLFSPGRSRTGNPNGGYRPRWIAIVATHITAAAAINTKNGLSVDLVDFAMTIPDRS